MQVGCRFIAVSMLMTPGYVTAMPMKADAQRQVDIELEIPGMDVVGFEHRARMPSQQLAVRGVVAVLEQGAEASVMRFR